MSESKTKENQYPNLNELKTYLNSTERKSDQVALSDAKALKTQLEKVDYTVPSELQAEIDRLEAKKLIIKLPNWAKENKWINDFKSQRSMFQKTLNKLGDMNPLISESLQNEINKIDKKLEMEQDSLGGVSRAKYARRARKILGLEDKLEDLGLDKGLAKIVKEQYESALHLLKISGLLKDSDKHPSKDKVKKTLRNNISPEQFEVIKQMDKPTLQLFFQKKTYKEYLTALNKYKPMPDQKEAYAYRCMKKSFAREDKKDNAKKGKIKGWRIVITEGADKPAMFSGDDGNKTIGERCEWFKNEFQDKGVQGMNFKSYVLLQISGFTKLKPKPVDFYGFTMLNGLEMLGKSIPCGRWSYGGYVYFFDTDNEDWGARFRPSVMIDVA